MHDRPTYNTIIKQDQLELEDLRTVARAVIRVAMIDTILATASKEQALSQVVITMMLMLCCR